MLKTEKTQRDRAGKGRIPKTNNHKTVKKPSDQNRTASACGLLCNKTDGKSNPEHIKAV
jgi:hypothetical protein